MGKAIGQVAELVAVVAAGVFFPPAAGLLSTLEFTAVIAGTSAGAPRPRWVPKQKALIAGALTAIDATPLTFEGFDPVRRLIGPLLVYGECLAAFGLAAPQAALVDPWLPARDGDLIMFRSALADGECLGKQLRLFGGSWYWCMTDGRPPIPVQPGDRIVGRIVCAFAIDAASDAGRASLEATELARASSDPADPVWQQLRARYAGAAEQFADTSAPPTWRIFQVQFPGKFAWESLEQQWPLVVPGRYFGALRAARQAQRNGMPVREVLDQARDLYRGGLTIPDCPAPATA